MTSSNHLGKEISLSTRLYWGSGLTLLLLLLVVVTSFYSITKFVKDARWVEDTHDVIDKILQAHSAATDEQNRVRGFVITGQEEFLAPRALAVERMRRNLRLLREPTADNPRQQERLGFLDSLTERRLEHSASLISTRNGSGQAAAEALIQSGEGKRLSDEIRRILEEMEAEERVLLQQRSAATQALGWRTTIFVASGLLLALIVVPLASFVAGREIARRTKAEAALRRAEAEIRQSHRALQTKFEAAIRATGQLVFEWDHQTNATWFGNVEPSLGYTAEELGDNLAVWVELVHPDDRDAFNREVERVVQARAPFHQEYRVRHKNGEYVYVEARGYFTPTQNGSLGRMVGIVADISNRKKLEEQFRQTQKMEAVGRLAGGIAHDFNNLLGVIIGFSDLLRDRIKNDDLAHKHLAQIRKAGDSAANLTRQLLAFSRKQVLEPQLLNLNEVVCDVTKMLHRFIGEDIKLVTVAASDLGTVRVDPGQVEQVILNLVVNARDAMPRGGKLTVETANVTLDETYARMHVSVNPGPYVMLAVSDTGIGMDAETQMRIFDPFFTTKQSGTGLGLATVYGIVKQSGGNIWVYSELGRGTTFKVYFPLLEGKTKPSSGQTQQAVPGGSETILLVEDCEPLRRVAREFLERGGYTVLETADTKEVVQLAEQGKHPMHLLLTDVVMPGMSGREVAEKVRRHCPRIKVLYISGYTDDAIAHHGVLDEGVALLSKPFTADSLLRRVRQVLDSQPS